MSGGQTFLVSPNGKSILGWPLSVSSVSQRRQKHYKLLSIKKRYRYRVGRLPLGRDQFCKVLTHSDILKAAHDSSTCPDVGCSDATWRSPGTEGEKRCERSLPKRETSRNNAKPFPSQLDLMKYRSSRWEAT